MPILRCDRERDRGPDTFYSVSTDREYHIPLQPVTSQKLQAMDPGKKREVEEGKKKMVEGRKQVVEGEESSFLRQKSKVLDKRP